MSEKHRKEIESLLNKSESGVNKRLQKLYKELAEETTQDIIKLAKEIEETDKFSKKLQKERLETIRSQMYAKANQLEGTQKENIYDFLRHDGQVAFNELFYDFEMTEKIPLSFTMLTDKQINVIINTPVANRKLSTRLKGNSTKMKQNLNRVLTRGFAKGLSTQKMAVQIAEIGGANYRRAMNIARTESGRVTSVARQQSQNHAKEIGLKLEKQWISTLDKLTRSNHQILDGKKIDIDAYFEIAGHKALQPHMFGVASEDCNCRCRTITIVNGMGPELRKKNESKEVGEYKNYEEWLANRTEPEAKKTKMRYNKDRKGFEIKSHNLPRNEAIKKLYDEFGMSIEETARTKLSETALNQTYSVLEGFKDLYNALPEKIPKVRAVTKSEAKDAIAWYSRKASNNTPVEFGINVSYFKGDEDLTNLVQNQVNSGWFSKNNSANHVMIHEFAHHIDHQLTGLHGSQFSNAVFARMAESDDSKYNFDNLSKQIGGYANTYYYKYKKHTESFAEIFAEAYGETPREIALDFKREFEKLSKEVIDDVDAT